MKPDSAKSPQESREGSEAPASPAPSAQALAPGGRPKLLLQKRTVADNPDVVSPPLPSATGDSKANPFGAARPIDTAAKERAIAEKKAQQAKEKKEAEEKAKEERRLAKEAAAKEAEEKAEKAAAEAAAAAAQPKPEPAEEKADVPAETKDTKETKEETAAPQNVAAGEQKAPTKPRENPKSRAVESGNWRTATGERSGRGGYQNATRGSRGEGRGRGGAPRGPRNFEGRPPRTNGAPAPAPAQQPSQPSSPAPFAEAEAAPAQDPDGWTTVPSKGRRNQGTRA